MLCEARRTSLSNARAMCMKQLRILAVNWLRQTYCWGQTNTQGTIMYVRTPFYLKWRSMQVGTFGLHAAHVLDALAIVWKRVAFFFDHFTIQFKLMLVLYNKSVVKSLSVIWLSVALCCGIFALLIKLLSKQATTWNNVDLMIFLQWIYPWYNAEFIYKPPWPMW